MGSKKEAKKSKVEQKIEDEKIQKIVKRLEGEDKVKERVRVDAKLMPSNPNQDGVNVKVKVQILDKSFYAKDAKLFFNAGAEKFEDIGMDKLDMDNFAVLLQNIPKEIQVLYYVQILDKSGIWTQFPRPEKVVKDSTEEEPYFSFSVEPDGAISFKKAWDDASLVNCRVCGYACQKSWDVCPECRTPLYDTTQEVFLDAEKSKTESRKQKKLEAEESWEDATDEEWRTLPECPSCGYTVQMEWQKCPVCNFDLSTVDLKKKVSHEDLMSAEEKENQEEQPESDSKKKKPEEKGIKKKDDSKWDRENKNGVDVL